MNRNDQTQRTPAVWGRIRIVGMLMMCLITAASAAIQPGEPGFVGRDALPVAAAATDAPSAPKKFGDLTQDVVYTPIAHCRIVDTRSMSAGPIAAGDTRNFIAVNTANFTLQGGSPTNCGTPGVIATAVNIAVTAITPALGGSATLFAYNTSPATSTLLSYAAGAVVTNTMLIAIPNPLASYDFTLASSQLSHYTIDILGYFAPPLATALQCLNSPETTTTVAPRAIVNLPAPACAAGYTETATQCESASWDMPLVSMAGGVCSVRNNGDWSAVLIASRRCCRVPGR